MGALMGMGGAAGAGGASAGGGMGGMGFLSGLMGGGEAAGGAAGGASGGGGIPGLGMLSGLLGGGGAGGSSSSDKMLTDAGMDQRMFNLGIGLMAQANGGGENYMSPLMQYAMSGPGSKKSDPNSDIKVPDPSFDSNNPLAPDKDPINLPGMKTAPTPFHVDPVATLKSFGYSDPAFLEAVPNVASSIAHLESGGRYGIQGPAVGDRGRAQGKYQVMPENIPQWTQEALGKSMTPEEYLASPEAQDKVALYKMAKYYQQYGNANDVSSMWLSGRPFKGNTRRDRVTGMSVNNYANNVASRL